MKVIVTGGAGFIGSNLCRRLLQDNYQVICIDNLLTGDERNIEELKKSSEFTFLKHDICEVLPADISADAIFHLASPASPNVSSPRSYRSLPMETMMANTQGTHNLLSFALEHNAKFLFSSTSEIYGDPLEHPQKETYLGNVSSIGVRSVYDEAKRFGETLTSYYMRERKLNARIVRIFNTYGPYMQPDDGRVVSNFITQAIKNQPITIYGDGNQTRSFCYVSDMVEGLIKAMFGEDTLGEVINLGNPDERSVTAIAKIIVDLTTSTSTITHEPLPEGDPLKRRPSIDKAKQLLGWEPKVTLEQGLTKTIEYFKSL